MQLTPAQLTTLKAAIAANASVAGGSSIYANVAIKDIPNNDDGNEAIAAFYNGAPAADFWVWRTSVFESEYTRTTSEDATTWSWPAYIARSIQEQNAWARLFMGGQTGCNPSLANVRQGVADIFSGSTNSAPAQRTHLLTISRRRSTRGEQLFATGVGSTASPATLAASASSSAANLAYVEGNFTRADISMARNS